VAQLLPDAATSPIERVFWEGEEIALTVGTLAPEDAEMIFEERMDEDIRAASASSHGEAADSGASEPSELDGGLSVVHEEFEEWRERRWRERNSHAGPSEDRGSMDPFPVDVDMSTGPGGMRRAVQLHYAPPPLDLSDLPNLLQHHDWPVRSANPAIPEQDPCVNEDGIEQWAPSIVRMDAYDAHEAAAAHFPHGIAIEIAPESLREIEGQTFGFCLDDFDDDDDDSGSGSAAAA